MLGECGLLEEAEARQLVAALHELKMQAERRELPISADQEDGHTALEIALTKRLGVAGRRIHLARSRNDQVQTALRLFMRARLLDLGEELQECAEAFVAFGSKHAASPLPGYTHMRRAMPSSWAMWSGAFAEGLLEELEQLPAVWQRLDRSPLGAAAGFGAPVKIDRARSAELLGFSSVQESPIDVMNSRGRHEQALASWIVSAAGTIEKALWDLAIWSTDEYAFVRLPDEFTTGSSLMPQKRNPDVLELTRGRCRELRGIASLLSHVAGGLPSSYHRDHQLLKEPLLQMIGKGRELFTVVARLLPGLRVNEAACAGACSDELRAAQEACRLAAEGMPFRDAYAAVAIQLADGTFSAPSASALGGETELSRLGNALGGHARWISDKRHFLATTTQRLFEWK
jgi:argininosuccinate lyase